MAEIFPDEGLAHLIEVIPRSNTGSFAVPTALYMGLFTSQTASTVPGSTTTLTGIATGTFVGPANSNMVECTSSGGYARATIGATAGALQTAYPTPVINGSGMRTTQVAPGTSFAESTGAYSATVNGFFVCNAASSTGQNTGKTFFYANFSDTTAITVNAAGYTIRVASFWHLDG